MQRNLQATEGFSNIPIGHTKVETRSTHPSVFSGLGGGNQCCVGAGDRSEERPIYFVSRTLHAAETRYQIIEKVTLALVLTARRIRPYFQNHSITVRTDYPIFKILFELDLAGRMIGWSVKLSEFDIWYQPRGAIKSQCLTDFSTELTPLPTLSAGWTLYVDGSSNKTACGAGVVFRRTKQSPPRASTLVWI